MSLSLGRLFKGWLKDNERHQFRLKIGHEGLLSRLFLGLLLN
jgi:hypothetical protein